MLMFLHEGVFFMIFSRIEHFFGAILHRMDGPLFNWNNGMKQKCWGLINRWMAMDAAAISIEHPWSRSWWGSMLKPNGWGRMDWVEEMQVSLCAVASDTNLCNKEKCLIMNFMFTFTLQEDAFWTNWWCKGRCYIPPRMLENPLTEGFQKGFPSNRCRRLIQGTTVVVAKVLDRN